MRDRGSSHTGHLGIPILGDFLHPSQGTGDFRHIVEREVYYQGSPAPEIFQLKEEVEQDTDFQELDGTKIAPTFGGRFQIRALAMWFVWRANEVGIRRARYDLRRFKQRKTLTGKFISPIIGFRSEKKINLTGGYQIEPLESLPIFSGKLAFAGSRGYSPNRPVRYSFYDKCALTYQVKYRIGDEIPTKPKEVSDEAFSIALIASCLEDTKFSLKRLVFTSAESSPFGFFPSGSSMTFYGKDLDFSVSAQNERYSLDVKRLRKLLRRIEEINIPDHIRNAIYHLWEAKFRQFDSDSYIFLGMALEIALNKGEDGGSNRDSISSSVKRRAAWLLGKNYSERKVIFDEIGRIYTLRSKVVHTGNISDKNKKFIDRKEHENLVSRLLQKLVISGDVDFDQLTLGG